MIKYPMKNNSDLKKINDFFNAEVHLGHKKNRVHPKAKKFIYKMENGVSIIDLTITLDQINKSKEFLKRSLKEGKSVLVIATKKIASQIITNFCKTNDISYITSKWPPGLLTNFNTLIKNIEKLKKLKESKESGEWEKIPKHERVFKNKSINKLEKFYGGITKIDKKPDILIIFDTKKENNAVDEAKKMNVTVIAVIDTNCNPEEVNYPIVANDDSPKAIECIINELFSEIKK
jgi:small subunit ribosomal protein S2